MKNFNFKRRNLFSGPHFLGTLLLLAGVVAFVSPAILKSQASLEKTYTVGAIATILGLIIISAYSGVLIDVVEKRVKEYTSICGFKFGQWASLPAIKTINVTSKQQKNTNTPNGISPTLSGTIVTFQTLLWSEKTTPEFIFTYTKKSRATQAAHYLADGLQATLEVKL